jgi:hypothetical protein
MASTSETGHAKNVANFEDLISFCVGYGAKYNPSKASIKLEGLQEVHARAKIAIASVNATLPAYSQAVGSREAAFEPLSRLVTRLTNAFAASDATAQSIDNTKTVSRKLQGRRASSKAETMPVAEGTTAADTPKSISVSQMSYDSRIENLDKLIQILQAEKAYAPNETELQVATLQTLLTDLRNKNTAVINATMPLSNARINRNETLYDAPSSLTEIAADVKLYAKSVFGATSPQYKQISGIKFTKPKI